MRVLPLQYASLLEELMSDLPLVIFAEDDDEDWLLISETLEEDCDAKLRVERVKDGEELVLRLADQDQPRPHLIMLDLKMPRKNGLEALKEIRSRIDIPIIPVIIMTTSNLETDVVRSYETGANSYIVKRVDHTSMSKALKTMYRYWNDLVKLPPPV